MTASGLENCPPQALHVGGGHCGEGDPALVESLDQRCLGEGESRSVNAASTRQPREERVHKWEKERLNFYI